MLPGLEPISWFMQAVCGRLLYQGNHGSTPRGIQLLARRTAERIAGEQVFGLVMIRVALMPSP
jgi:hypothetical protein